MAARRNRMTAPILFLDVDGVLNRNSTKRGDGVHEAILIPKGQSRVFTGLVEEELVRAVVQCVQVCGAKIVVSSSWRNVFDSAGQFAAAIAITPPLASAPDLFHRDWRTPFKMSSNRHHEISWWLDDHRVERFSILDDHDVCLHAPELAPHFVMTDSRRGVTDEDLARVATMLGR
jgi:hypothetical protein